MSADITTPGGEDPLRPPFHFDRSFASLEEEKGRGGGEVEEEEEEEKGEEERRENGSVWALDVYGGHRCEGAKPAGIVETVRHGERSRAHDDLTHPSRGVAGTYCIMLLPVALI